MLAWSIGGSAAVFLSLSGYAGYKAVSAQDERVRADAYKVLKLVLAAVTGTGVALAAALRQAGLL